MRPLPTGIGKYDKNGQSILAAPSPCGHTHRATTQNRGSVKASAEGTRERSHSLEPLLYQRSGHMGHGDASVVCRPASQHSCLPTPAMALKPPRQAGWGIESRQHPTVAGLTWNQGGMQGKHKEKRTVRSKARPCFRGWAASFHVALLSFLVPGMERCHLEMLGRLLGVAFCSLSS